MRRYWKLKAPQNDKAKPSNPFRILMILDKPFPPDIRVENELRSLAKAGFEVFLLVLAPDDRISTEKSGGGHIIKCHVPRKLSNWMRGLAGTLPLLSWFIAHQIKKLHKQYSFNAIHAHDLYMCGGALKAGKRFGIPVVADLHEIWPSVLSHYAWSTRLPGKLFISIRRWMILEKKWTVSSEKIIVITDEMRSRYISLGCSPKDIIVLPNTINTDLFDRYPVNKSIIQKHQSELTLVYTGTINSHRGLDFLLDCMPLILRHCKVRVVIVGEGRIRTELEAQAESLKISDHVIFEGWRPQSEIKSYILCSDICILPLIKCEQTEKAAPHKLFHYMYLKRPQVVTDCSYIQSVVESTHCGLVAPYGDTEAFASCIIKLYRNPELREKMGENGHQAIVDRYNWNATAQPLIDMYSHLKQEAEY